MDQYKEIKSQEVFYEKMSVKNNDCEEKLPLRTGKQNFTGYLNRNGGKQNLQPTIIKQFINMNDISNLPVQINELIKKNRFLQKQNSYLRQQLRQKQGQIFDLKQEVYQSILDQTQNKLYCIKLIQQESDIKAKQIINKKIGKLYQSDQKLLELKSQIDELQKQLKKERKNNQILAKNVVQLKEYIISAMEEKDLIIHELKNMIVEINQNDQLVYDIRQRYSKVQNDLIFEKHHSKEKPYCIKSTKFANIKDEQQHFNITNKTTKAKIVKNY